MSARRCSLCGINYPVQPKYQRCPVHDEPTDYFVNIDVDENWEWAATALLHRITPEKLSDVNSLIPVVPVELRQDDDGRYWISSIALISLGLQKRLQGDDVIEIPRPDLRPKDHPCDCFWEVMAYRYSTREYWVKPLRVPDFVPRGQ